MTRKDDGRRTITRMDDVLSEREVANLTRLSPYGAHRYLTRTDTLRLVGSHEALRTRVREYEDTNSSVYVDWQQVAESRLVEAESLRRALQEITEDDSGIYANVKQIARRAVAEPPESAAAQ